MLNNSLNFLTFVFFLTPLFFNLSCCVTTQSPKKAGILLISSQGCCKFYMKYTSKCFAYGRDSIHRSLLLHPVSTPHVQSEQAAQSSWNHTARAAPLPASSCPICTSSLSLHPQSATDRSGRGNQVHSTKL